MMLRERGIFSSLAAEINFGYNISAERKKDLPVNWRDQYYYKPDDKNYFEKKYNQDQKLKEYADRVCFYFDLECSTDKILVDYLMDENGNFNEMLIIKINMVINHFYICRKSVNDCAMMIKSYLDGNGLVLR